MSRLEIARASVSTARAVLLDPLLSFFDKTFMVPPLFGLSKF